MASANDAIRRLFAPRAVAVVGASREAGSRSSRLIANLRRQFRGPVFPVNPNATEIEGLRAYPNLAAIPEEVDVAVVLVAATRLLPALDDCAAAGVKAAICYASIPSDPRPLCDAIKQLAARTGMRVVGPNCLGLFDVNSGVALTYTVVAAAPEGAPPGSVAILGQSGGVLHTIWTKGEELGVRHSHFISTGNEADLTFEDFLEFLLGDPNVRTMCCYVEGIRNPALLAELAMRARDRDKAIVALKVGHSPEAQRAAMSHTGALVGSMRHADAFLDRIGVIRVEGMSESGSLASILRAPLPPVDGVGVLTTTGGMSAGMADLCGRYGISLPSLGPEARRVIHDLLLPSGIMNPDADNPVDLGAPAVNDREVWTGTLEAMLADERIGLVLATLGGGQAELGARSAALAREAGKPIVFYIYSRFNDGGETGFEPLAAEGIPVYTSDSEAVKAIAAFVRYVRWRREAPPPPAGPALTSPVSAPVAVLGEAAAKHWLAQRGIPFPRSAEAAGEAKLAELAESVGYPLVLKVSDPRILHKSEAGGVRVGIRDRRELAAALAEMRVALAGAGFADPAGFLVEEMVGDGGIEWLVGVDNDPHFGPVIAFGVGGVLAEAVRDVAVEPVPLTRLRAEALLRRVAAGHVLEAGAFRGRAVDRDALVELLLRASDLTVAAGGTVVELDLNPVVTVPGRGALALDARLLLAAPAARPPEVPDAAYPFRA